MRDPNQIAVARPVAVMQVPSQRLFGVSADRKMIAETTEAAFNKDEELLLTVEELCKWLKVPKSWVYERVRARKGLKLPHIKLGHYLRFERDAVQEFLRRHRKSYSLLGRAN